MRIYISGPMTGVPDLNRPAFDAAERRLTEQGNFVINPHHISEMFGAAEELAKSFDRYYSICSYLIGISCREEEYLGQKAPIAKSVIDADLAAIRSCDAIYLLHGWESSRGAKKELAEALAHGLKIMQEGEEE